MKQAADERLSSAARSMCPTWRISRISAVPGRLVGHGAWVAVDRDVLLPRDQRPLPTVVAVTEHAQPGVIPAAVQVDTLPVRVPAPTSGPTPPLATRHRRAEHGSAR